MCSVISLTKSSTKDSEQYEDVEDNVGFGEEEEEEPDPNHSPDPQESDANDTFDP